MRAWLYTCATLRPCSRAISLAAVSELVPGASTTIYWPGIASPLAKAGWLFCGAKKRANKKAAAKAITNFVLRFVDMGEILGENRGMGSRTLGQIVKEGFQALKQHLLLFFLQNLKFF